MIGALVVRQHLIVQQAGKLGQGSRAEIEKKMLEDEEILFAWSIASVDKTSSILLKMIVELWLTIRGFSFAGAFIEQYKSATKKSLQRSKALRKKVSSVSFHNSKLVGLLKIPAHLDFRLLAPFAADTQ